MFQQESWTFFKAKLDLSVTVVAQPVHVSITSFPIKKNEKITMRKSHTRPFKTFVLYSRKKLLQNYVTRQYLIVLRVLGREQHNKLGSKVYSWRFLRMFKAFLKGQRVPLKI